MLEELIVRDLSPHQSQSSWLTTASRYPRVSAQMMSIRRAPGAYCVYLDGYLKGAVVADGVDADDLAVFGQLH